MKDKNNPLVKTMLCIAKKAKTPEKKYSQLRKDYDILTTDVDATLDVVLKNILIICYKNGTYCGFSKEFWVSVNDEHLKKKFLT